MSDVSRFETDRLLQLLTEALRAGPGSPQWHEAVLHLRATRSGEAEEYRLLMAAREHLESGHDYRSIRGGPGFERKVMQAIDEAEIRRSALPPANVVAMLAAAGIITVIIAVGVILSRGSGPVGGSIADLAATYFARPVVEADFAQGIGSDWRTFGLEPAISPREQALRSGLRKDASAPRDGGLHVASPIAPDQPFAIEATISVNRHSSQVDLQLFVSESPTAARPQEFVVDLMNGQLSIFKPGVRLAGDPARTGESRVQLLVKMDRQFAIVTANGQTLYEGPHGLSPAAARWPGLRFVPHGPEKNLDDVTVQSMKVIKP